MATSFPRFQARVLLVVMALLELVASPSFAQPSPDCAALLPVAHGHYTDQEFGMAERAVHDCLAHAEIADEDALDAYRLLALVHLRQNELAQAKQAVIQLLDVSLAYAPDPVLDPPPYVALVEATRAQIPAPALTPVLAVVPVVEESVAEALSETPISNPTGRTIQLGVSLGAGSYSGERGINGGSLAEEFRLNGGLSLALDGSYAIAPTLAAVVSYRAVRFPLLLTNDVRAEDVHVRPEDSSAWVHVLALMARAHIGPEALVHPYAQAGVSGFFSHLNDEMRVGVGPQLGAGFDVQVTPELVGFAELNLAVSFPGDAVDRVSSDGAVSDLLTFLGVGLRYEVAIP